VEAVPGARRLVLAGEFLAGDTGGQGQGENQPFHIAETREKAIENASAGFERWQLYSYSVNPEGGAAIWMPSIEEISVIVGCLYLPNGNPAPGPIRGTAREPREFGRRDNPRRRPPKRNRSSLRLPLQHALPARGFGVRDGGACPGPGGREPVRSLSSPDRQDQAANSLNANIALCVEMLGITRSR
jgi:hypothetical protein